jgi:hypothetical protein
MIPVVRISLDPEDETIRGFQSSGGARLSPSRILGECAATAPALDQVDRDLDTIRAAGRSRFPGHRWSGFCLCTIPLWFR